MKITWDNIDEFKYKPKKGLFQNFYAYVLREGDNCCINCGEPYFARYSQIKKGKGLLCSGKCQSVGELNPMYGKTHTDEVKDMLRENIKKSQKTIKKRYGVDNVSQLDSIKLKKGQTVAGPDNKDYFIHIIIYKTAVYHYTKQSYRRYTDIINPDNLPRGRGKYHLDHKYSITEGFKNNVPPFIMGSADNLEMLSEIDNLTKGGKCSITRENLYNEYYKQN